MTPLSAASTTSVRAGTGSTVVDAVRRKLSGSPMRPTIPAAQPGARRIDAVIRHRRIRTEPGTIRKG
jgi:hypothetical protein